MNPGSTIKNYVKQVSTGAIQDYLNYLIKGVHGSDESWKQKALDHANSMIAAKKFATNYLSVARKIEDKGIANFSVTDWDITALGTVFKYMKDQLDLPRIPQETYNLLSAIVIDKNEDSHDSTNETVEDTLPWVNSALKRLSRFIESASKDGNLSFPDRTAFYQKQMEKLESAQHEIRAEYDSEYKKEREIARVIEIDAQEIASSENPDSTYIQKLEKWNLINDGTDRFATQRWIYMLKRSVTDKGYSAAAEAIGDAFFYGQFEAIDYEKAAYYYEQREVCELHPDAQLNLASIYVNGLSSTGSVSDAESIIKRVTLIGKKSKKPFLVTSYKKDGNTFFHRSRPPLKDSSC